MAGDPLKEFRVRPKPWVRYGDCGTVDPDMWFPERADAAEGDGALPGYEAYLDDEFEEEPGRELVGTVEAKRICARCPVRLNCLWDAIDNGDNYGIWGGMTPRERRKVKESYLSPFQHQKAG